PVCVCYKLAALFSTAWNRREQMTVFKRDKFGRTIPKAKRNKVQGVWYYDFTDTDGVRHRKNIPEAVTEQQAKLAEAAARTEVFKGKYGQKTGRANFEKFVRDIYLPWSREHKRSFKQDEYYAEIICDCFRGKTFADISPILIEKFKRQRREGITTRGEKRN